MRWQHAQAVSSSVRAFLSPWRRRATSVAWRSYSSKSMYVGTCCFLLCVDRDGTRCFVRAFYAQHERAYPCYLRFFRSECRLRTTPHPLLCMKSTSVGLCGVVVEDGCLPHRCAAPACPAQAVAAWRFRLRPTPPSCKSSPEQPAPKQQCVPAVNFSVCVLRHVLVWPGCRTVFFLSVGGRHRHCRFSPASRAAARVCFPEACCCQRRGVRHSMGLRVRRDEGNRGVVTRSHEIQAGLATTVKEKPCDT